MLSTWLRAGDKQPGMAIIFMPTYKLPGNWLLLEMEWWTRLIFRLIQQGSSQWARLDWPAMWNEGSS